MGEGSLGRPGSTVYGGWLRKMPGGMRGQAVPGELAEIRAGACKLWEANT